MSQARFIAIAIYLSGLVVLPSLGLWIKPPRPAPGELLRLLPLVFLVVAVTEYGLSLFLEARLLSVRIRPKQSQSPPFAAAIVSAAMGASIAIYGFVLGLLGAPGWAPVFYLASLIHGVHLMVRWPNLERAAEQQSGGSE
jgi:hypothetical protein